MYIDISKYMFGNLRNAYFYDAFMDGNDFVIQFIVPGFSENELELSVNKGVLRLVGRKEKPASKLLPKNIHGEIFIEDDFEIADATLENGVLTVTMRRKTQMGVKIPIKAISSRTHEKSQVLMENNNQENNNM